MKITVSRDSTMPLRTQLLNQLRHLVLSGEWAPGSRIPSETELKRQLNISRSTVRAALSNAEVEGLIRRVPGKGTFVARLPGSSTLKHMIGYVTHSLPRSSLTSMLLSGAESAAKEKGYQIVFCTSEVDVHEENQVLDQLMRNRVGGVLIWAVPSNDPSRRLLALANHGLVPVVLLDRTFPGLNCDYVACDNRTGSYAAVQHLLSLGHTRIVFLCQEPMVTSPSTVVERMEAYQDAMRDAGLVPLQPWLISSGPREMTFSEALRIYSSPSSQEIEQIAEHLAGPQRPTAVFAANDLWAMQTMKAAALAGLQVPDDLSVVGFDDIDIAAHLQVSLTTVVQDGFAIGKRAAELLIERIEGYNGPPREERVDTRLKVRDSSAPPKPVKGV